MPRRPSPPSSPAPDCLAEPQSCNSQSYAREIFVLALAARLGVFWYVLTHFPRGWIYTRGQELGVLGRSLALGHGYNSPFGGSTGPTAVIAPGYPLVIAAIFRVFGSLTHGSEIAILLLHIAFSVTTVALILHVARRTVGVRVANLAGAFWAVALPLIWMQVIFWDTCASAMLLTGFVALALRCVRKPALLLWIGAGAYCGLTLLINPSLLLALLGVLGWMAWQTAFPAERVPVQIRPAPAERLKRLQGPVVAVLTMAAVFSPWPIRNGQQMHAFVPFRSNAGYELWNGNQPGGDGRFVEALHPMLDRGQFERYAEVGEMGYMEEKSAAGKASIRAHPAEFLRVSAWRVGAFWAGLAQGEAHNSGAIIGHALITSCLGWAGLALLWRRNRRVAWLFLLPLLLFPLPYYVTHPDFRFRLLLDPLLTVLAGYAVVQCADELRRWRTLGSSTVSRA